VLGQVNRRKRPKDALSRKVRHACAQGEISPILWSAVERVENPDRPGKAIGPRGEIR